MTIKTDANTFAPGIIVGVANKILGEPNARLSTEGKPKYGTNGSLSIDAEKNTYYDHEANSGGGLLDFIVNQGQATNKREAADWLKGNGAISEIVKSAAQKPKREPLGAPVARYTYRDESGNAITEVRRYEPKTFRQFSLTPDGWKNSTDGARVIPYQLDKLVKAPPDATIYIPEGEKDVDRLFAIGLVATCNAGGSGKWRDTHSEHLKGRAVVVVPDNDKAGREHAQKTVKSLLKYAKEVSVLELPGLPEKGDISDWLDAGGTLDQLLKQPAIKQAEVQSEDDTDDAPFGSELALSDEFAKLAAGKMRWTAGLEWMVNKGTHWEPDDSLTRFTMAKKICKGAASELEKEKAKIAAKICSAGTHHAILSLARSSEGIVTGMTEWDAHPMLLNTPGEVIDLTTGRPVKRDGLLFTQVSGASPKAMPTPTWDKFISEVFDGDLEMVDFMQRMGGYSLTGSIKEQKLFFLHGSGANGKSVFLDVLRALGGKYSYNLPSEALMTSKHEGHPAQFASLHGKRLAVSSEIEESAHWAESRIKAMTGDETMTARFMRQNPFEFKITHKHIIAGNSKPRLKGDDFAMVRRMVLIPFSQRFEGSRRDNNLPEKLKAEYPGILAWFIEGAKKWASTGLGIPETIVNASREYMQEQDDIGLWIDGCCDKVKGYRELSSHLFTSFDSWKKTHGEHAGSEKTFSQRLERIYTRERTKRGKEFSGLRLKHFAPEGFDAVNSYREASRGD